MFPERIEQMDATESNAWFEQNFATRDVMAIFRGYGIARTLELAERAWAAGIGLVEVTIQSPADLEALEATAALGARSGHPVAAGTVTTRMHVAQAKERGAAFVVSPGLDLAIVADALAAGLPTLPGVSTASELQALQGLGLNWAKVFPAAILGASWFSILHGPFPELNFVATGGLTAASAPDFLAAGARVVAVGSAIGNPTELAELADLITAREMPR
jgi:2-dehydro-3-deoxyphosphogluconate aldolase/(4S)-4-hydroxy-2-oxoglutarate aldolase